MMKDDPRCHLCGMILSMENLIHAAQNFPPEKLCKHGVTNPPVFDAAGFLASGPFSTRAGADLEGR